MTQDQLLARLKKDIRSLLISTKHGLTPEQLKKDYQNMLGRPLPLKILGFCNVLDMVKEMPDVVRMEFVGNGGIVLKAISDSTTKGIEELVSKQRDHKPKSSRTWSGSFHSVHRKHPLVLPRKSSTVPALPAQLRSQLRQLLHNHPISLSELEAHYAARFGKPLAVTQHGYYSIAEMLSAATDMIAVRQGRLGSYLILKPAMSPIVQTPVLAPVFSDHPMWITNFIPKRPYVSAPRQKVVLNNGTATEKTEYKKTADVGAQEAKAVHLPPEAAEELTTFEKSVAKLEEEFRQKIIENGPEGAVNQELKDKLRKVVASHSHGMTIHSLPNEYKKMYGEDFPLAQCGFQNVTEMVGALSDTFYLQPGPEDGGASRLLIMGHKQVDPPTAVSESEVCQSAESLNPSSKSYYFSCSESAWDQEDKGDESQTSSESETETVITNRTVHQSADVFPVMVLSRYSPVPLDAVQCQKLKAPTRRKEKELVAVLVERVESPSHFYIRFYEEPDSRALENMMIEMRSCYSCPDVSEQYRLLDAYVRPGQACCVAPQDLWFYRVVIHRVPSKAEVEVYYVDFGDITTVKRSSLLFLKSCYAELPAQAVPSVLVGVKPSEGSWTKEAVSTFRKLCCERILVAAVHSYRDYFLLLFLCDTHTDEDVYIHTVLQAEDGAVPCSPAGTPVFKQFNPARLYLGEGRLAEVMTSCSDVTKGQNPMHPSRPDISSDGEKQPTDDIPALEFIHLSQGEKGNMFDAFLDKNPAVFNNWDQEWVDESVSHHKSKPAEKWQEESAKTSVEPVTEPPPLSKAVCETEVSQNPASTSQSFHLITSTAKTENTSDLSVGAFKSPPFSLMFPVFGLAGDKLASNVFFRHASPLAMSPAARVAAPSSRHHWYTSSKQA